MGPSVVQYSIDTCHWPQKVGHWTNQSVYCIKVQNISQEQKTLQLIMIYNYQQLLNSYSVVLYKVRKARIITD
jgi:hypothetical protein